MDFGSYLRRLGKYLEQIMQYTTPTWRITRSEDIPKGGRVVRLERVINASGARRNRCLKETDDIMVRGPAC